MAMASFWVFPFLMVVVVVEEVELVVGSYLGRCLRFREAMGGGVKRTGGEVGETREKRSWGPCYKGAAITHGVTRVRAWDGEGWHV